MFDVFRRGRAMKKHTPYLARHRFVFPCMLVAAVMLLVVDMTVTTMSLRGQLFIAQINLIPAVFVVVCYIGVISWSFWLNGFVKKEVKAALIASSKNNSTLLAFVRKMNKMQRYLLISAVGRIGTVLGLLMGGSGLMFHSQFVYGFTMVGLLTVTSFVSSIAQVCVNTYFFTFVVNSHICT